MTHPSGHYSNHERLNESDHSQQSHSHRPRSSRSHRESSKEQKRLRQNAIKEVEKHFVNMSVQYILGETDELNLPDEHGCGLLVKNEESLHGYLGRISTTIYQKLYNKLMNRSQVGSSYSFNKRTSGNALDSNGIVFMKDLDPDHIAKQAISIAFRKQIAQSQQQDGCTSAATNVKPKS